MKGHNILKLNLEFSYTIQVPFLQKIAEWLLSVHIFLSFLLHPTSGNTQASTHKGVIVLHWYGYFVVKTVMPSPFSAKKWPHGHKAERKTASDFVLTERLPKNC